MNLSQLKKEEIKKLNWKEIFLSPQYKNDLQQITNTTAKKIGYKKQIVVNLCYDKNDNSCAYTDGRMICINLGSDFGKRLRRKPTLMHIFIVGLIAHELGHIFWTEFNDSDKYTNFLLLGVIYPTVPVHPNAQKFVDALNDKVNRSILTNICHTIDNILEDIFVNALQRKMFGGLFTQGINLGNQLIAEDSLTVTQQKAQNYKDLNIIMNAMITQLKAGVVYYGSYEGEIKDVAVAVEKIARRYIFKKTHAERVEGINLIVCELWDYVQEVLDNIKQSSQKNNSANNTSSQGSGSSNGSSTSDSENSDNSDGSDSESSSGSSSSGNSGSDSSSNSGSSDNSEENTEETANSQNSENSEDSEEIDEEKLEAAIKEIINQIEGQTSETKNAEENSEKANADSALDELGKGNDDKSLNDLLSSLLSEKSRMPKSVGEAVMTSGSGEIVRDRNYVSSGISEATRELSSIIENAAKERACTKAEQKIKKEMTSEISDINFGEIHRCVPLVIHRMASVPSEFVTEFNTFASNIRPYAETLSNVILRNIKEENLTGEQKRLYCGNTLDKSRLYHPDLRVFKNRKKPKKEISFALSILIDESGSMAGGNIYYAQLTAIMFALAAEKIGFPIEIFGHTTGINNVDMYNYCNFDSVDKMDKYRLMDVQARGCNRDGKAIIFAAERLKKRKEQKKMFIIISDGQPNHQSYYGEAAKSDLKHIKNKYTKDGIDFVAAAIDSDKEYIKEIYGKNFLNISHLDQMAKIFGEILKNRI